MAKSKRNAAAVVLWALGAMGRTLITEHPTDWQRRLEALKAIDWRRTNREWQGVAMSGSDVDNSDSDWNGLRYLEQACEPVTNCDWFPKAPGPPRFPCAFTEHGAIPCRVRRKRRR